VNQRLSSQLFLPIPDQRAHFNQKVRFVKIQPIFPKCLSWVAAGGCPPAAPTDWVSLPIPPKRFIPEKVKSEKAMTFCYSSPLPFIFLQHVGHPRTPVHFVDRIEKLARTTDLSVRQIHKKLKGNVGRGVVGDIVKRMRKKEAPLSQ
jgi:hypothetical protein